MASRKLEDLHPTVADMARRLIELAQTEGTEIIVTSTLRTFEEQADLYAIGRTKPGTKVTNAGPGDSWHNYGLAFDVVPLINGKAVWNVPFWERIGEIGKSVGLTWGGDFKSFKDKPHFEYHPNLNLAEAKRRHESNEELLT